MSNETPHFIVSANYRDRHSEYKWLIRKEDEPLSAAKAYKHVFAINVTFVQLFKELGFGCFMVARCADAVGTYPQAVDPPAPSPNDTQTNGTRLRFNGMDFVNADTGKDVDACSALELTEDGRMYSVRPRANGDVNDEA